MPKKAHCKAVMDHFETELIGLPNVVALGIVPEKEGNGDDEAMSIAVYVSKKVANHELAEHEKVPATLELSHEGKVITVPTKVIESGFISFDGPGLA